jgi:hypothetical protein
MYADPLFSPSRLEEDEEDVSISIQPAVIATLLGWLIALVRVAIARRGHEMIGVDLVLAAAALAAGPVLWLGLLLSALGPRPHVDVRPRPHVDVRVQARPHEGGSQR